LSPFQRFYLWFVGIAVLGPFIPLVIASFAFRWNWPDLLPSVWWWTARTTAHFGKEQRGQGFDATTPNKKG
jgi:putative spermidine/putrescine transport system permease protein